MCYLMGCDEEVDKSNVQRKENVMKKFVICICVLVIVATHVFAVNFSPTVMNISAPEVIGYDFDGK